MRKPFLSLCLTGWSLLAVALPASAQLQAVIRLPADTVQLGDPILVDFMLYNPTLQPITVPGAGQPDAAGGVGLAASYAQAGLSVVGPSGALPPAATKPAGKGVDLKIAPQSMVGARLSLTDLAPGVAEPGIYTLTFKPQGVTTPASVMLTVHKKLLATIETNFGNMTVEFYPGLAPLTVENFVELARSGFYDGKNFHRIIKDFMIQGGCPKGDGSGNRYDGKLLKHEGRPDGAKNLRGCLAMARTKDPNSASCQFFICHKDCPFLDYKSMADPGYVVFGRLVGDVSYETLDKIASVETVMGADGAKSKPIQPVIIKRITIH